MFLVGTIGDDSSVRRRIDPWVQSIHSGIHILKYQFSIWAFRPICDLADPLFGGWNGTLIEEIFISDHVDAILNVPFPVRQLKDRCIWWLTDLMLRLKLLGWRIAWNILPSADVLLARSMSVEYICSMVCHLGY